MTISPSPAYELTPREALIMDIMDLIDAAASSDEPVCSHYLAEQIVERFDEKPASHAAAEEATNVQGADERLRKIVAASAAKFRAEPA